ncbi:hypothetical protein FSP39_008617 [Pinctada imbricata]|uniref:TIR domain-containing protein n=1 Tax=Pinctada imbricata TaxID=66713 RepID=A0AA89BN64_PINIB|nr:hypothetical protein FSP39_008617 [Pinctada imbricata]
MREIYMQGNIIRRLDISGIIPVSTQHVDLSDNFCSYIEKSYFPPGSKMRTLNLQGNLLGDFLDSEASSDIFQNIQSLHTLLLSGNRIHGMNMDILTPLSDLRHLDLSVNEIDQLLISLRYFSNLTMLNLSRNRLMYLNKVNIKDLEHIYTSRRPVRKLNINLRYNQLQCSCETMFFLKWMLRYQDGTSIEFHNLTQYTCSSPNLTTLHFENLDKIVDHFERICSSEEPIIVLGTIFIITFFFIIIFGIGHRYRWKIRFFYYSTKRVFRTLDTVSERHFEYDVFLSYADEDRHFVHNIILHELENDERGFKVCCHFRDFTAGRPIADNIAEAIHISRYTLCVISAHYLNSYWCMYEHNLAMMEMELARGGKDTVILLLTSTFRADEAPLSFLRFIQKNSYLEVPPENEDESKLLFVERLKNIFVRNP